MKIAVAIFLLIVTVPAFAGASQVGTVAPDFSLPDLTGKTINLQKFKGKVVLLDFWMPWCEPCKEEFPALDALYKKYRNDGLEIIGINLDDSEKRLHEFIQKVPVSFTILTDKNEITRRSYDFPILPSAFIVGKDGVIRYVHIGYHKEYLQMYKSEIVELLKQP
jgi:peroxiredoxin